MAAEEKKDEAISAAKMLEELKLENEKLLENHKRAIEAEYEAKMQEFLQKLAPPPRGSPSKLGQASNVLEALKQSRPVIGPDEADATTEQFLRMSQTGSSQPEIRVYEDGQPRQLVRASMEGTKQVPVVVKASGEIEEDDAQFVASIASKNLSRKKQKGVKIGPLKLPCTHLSRIIR